MTALSSGGKLGKSVNVFIVFILLSHGPCSCDSLPRSHLMRSSRIGRVMMILFAEFAFSMVGWRRWTIEISPLLEVEDMLYYRPGIINSRTQYSGSRSYRLRPFGPQDLFQPIHGRLSISQCEFAGFTHSITWSKVATFLRVSFQPSFFLVILEGEETNRLHSDIRQPRTLPCSSSD